MKRDDDFLRSLLPKAEESDSPYLFKPNRLGMTPDELKERYHIELLNDAGFLITKNASQYQISSAGHDYLESIRDDGIWQRTKAVVAETGGNATLEILRSLASGFLKKKLAIGRV